VFTSSISCCAVSAGFHSVVIGTRDGSLLFCSLNSGSVVKSVALDGRRPLQILVTPSWGFVIVYMTRIASGKIDHILALYSVNGDVIRSVTVPRAVRTWSAFTSADGFDFVLMADAAGACFVFEAFFLRIGEEFFKCAASVVSMSFLIAEATAVLALEDGTVVFAPVASD
jgi:hypothetical protein